MNLEDAIKEIREREIDERKEIEVAITAPVKQVFREIRERGGFEDWRDFELTMTRILETKFRDVEKAATEAERVRCKEMLTRCKNVYDRNNPPRISRHEAFMKTTAIEYALMVVFDWSLGEEYRDDMMPLPY